MKNVVVLVSALWLIFVGISIICQADPKIETLDDPAYLGGAPFVSGLAFLLAAMIAGGGRLSLICFFVHVGLISFIYLVGIRHVISFIALPLSVLFALPAFGGLALENQKTPGTNENVSPV